MTTLLILIAGVPAIAAFAGWACVAATYWYETRHHFRHPPARTSPPAPKRTVRMRPQLNPPDEPHSTKQHREPAAYAGPVAR
ncbi:hypothetical protein BJY24_004115 [Nocardia transvalensis]|uniref:Uncharacterized protein n=1 Tax=Nocardia transvalensis TaxID=37333 RepID=A0A7W9PGL2_9NOCA|nr:hypothetical protein [Nocardia transvalensis]